MRSKQLQFLLASVMEQFDWKRVSKLLLQLSVLLETLGELSLERKVRWTDRTKTRVLVLSLCAAELITLGLILVL